MRANSLTTRFLLAILLSTTLPFLAFGWYAQDGMRKHLEERVADVFLPQDAENAATGIATRLANAQRAGWLMAKLAEDVLNKISDFATFEEFVLMNLGENREFDFVLLADDDGQVLQVIASENLDRDRRNEFQSLQPESVADTEWFRGIQADHTGYWQNRHLSPFFFRDPDRQLRDPTRYSLGLALPVQTEGGDYGALYLAVQWKLVQDVLDDAERFLREDAGLPSAQVFLCDSDGKILAHTDRSLYGQTLEPKELRETVAREARGDVAFVPVAGGPRHAGFSALPGDSYETDFDWRVGLHAEARELFKESRAFGHRLLVVIGLITGVLVIWALLSSRAILRPVRRLSEATRRVAHGDLAVRVDARGGTELSELSRDFNTMAEDLAESREKLRDAERQAAWAEMARQVAHEIKNPLTPMRMAAQLLLKARREEDPRWEALSDRLARTVVQQTEALDRIAADFRQFAGPPVRDLAVVQADDFLAGVEELVSSMAEASGMSIAFRYGAQEAQVLMDRQEMRRVFLNLIHNAIQACDGRGQIEVISDITVINGQPATEPDGGMDTQVCFRVCDNGPGIPEDVQNKLFEPYFTTKTSGTGLGLAICRRILAAHGGSIVLESSLTGQTVFRMQLPVTTPEV